MKISYNWLKWYIPDLPAPEKLADVFTYHLTEVEGVETFIGKDGTEDTIFDINILPNRAHDLLSHRGVAKELSGLLNIPFNDHSNSHKEVESEKTELAVDVKSNAVRRYSARIIRGVKVGPSPDWVVKHLESIGQRSINNIVDATNLVMFNVGQPTHAFDLVKIKGQIKIRNAKAGEKIIILGGEEKELLETDTVISDEEGALAIAGVKGGTKAEVDENTKDILIEVANFEPTAVRKSARRLGILTDSTKRFENDLSPEYATLGMREISALIKEMFPDAVFEDVVDIYDSKGDWQEKKKVVVSQKDVNRILGTDFDLATITTAVASFGFDYSETNGIFQIFVPKERIDLNVMQDMAEEIGRTIGYEKVAPVMPEIPTKPKINETFAKIFAAREKLLSEGYSETMTYTFGKKGKVEVARGPKGKSNLRTNLSDGLKESYEMNKLNAGVLGLDEVKIFEIGNVFTGDAEILNIALADKKGIVEKTLDQFVEENNIDISSYKIPADVVWENKHFKPWSLFPFITRDIAVFVPNEIDKTEIEDILKDANLLVRAPRLVDVYQKDYKTSYAYRLVFQSDEKTLTDDEVAPIMEDLYKKIKDKGWEIR
jgi:phenylalanyl-tRNA synthetase beta chain